MLKTTKRPKWNRVSLNTHTPIYIYLYLQSSVGNGDDESKVEIIKFETMEILKLNIIEKLTKSDQLYLWKSVLNQEAMNQNILSFCLERIFQFIQCIEL